MAGRTLVAVALLAGYFLILRIARVRKLDTLLAAEMSFTMIAVGLAGAHLFRFAYLPELVAADPLVILRRSAGIASFGGILGGLAGALAWLRYRRQSAETTLRYLDVIAFVFPFAWIFGRMACVLSHDHPGAFTTSWLGVQYPDGIRYDLGLIEVLFTAALALLFLTLRRWSFPPGFYPGLLLSLYAPFRFLLDQLHVDPPRYFGWTVDQLASVTAGIIGLVFLVPRQTEGVS